MLPFRPKLTPFELEKTTFDKLVDVVPALTLILEIVAALDAMAVVKKAGTPSVKPDVLSVPAITAPAEVVVAKAVPAYLLLSWLKAAVVR